jgi:hypothetical protein
MMSVSAEGLQVLIGDFQSMPRGLRSAIVRSLNRGIVSGQTVMARSIAADTGLKVGDVKAAFKLAKATDGRPEASVSAAGLKRLPLIDFKARGPEPSRGRGNGVTYQLQGGRNAIPNAFIATMKTGHRGVFARVGKTRLPIRELFGPSLTKVFIKYQTVGETRARESFVANLEHELGRMGLSFDEAIAAAADQDIEDDGTE